MWNRFWNTLDNDTDSVHSAEGMSGIHHRSETPSGHHMHGPSVDASSLNRLASDLLVPNDSASVAAVQDEVHSAPGSPVAPPRDEGFVFKFKSPAGRVHRFRFDPVSGLEEFRNLLADKLRSEEKAVVGEAASGDGGFAISFVDDEGDIVSILSIADLTESVVIAKRSGREKVDLYIHHPNTPPVVEVAVPARVTATVEKVEEAEPSRERAKDVINGIPNELLLPGALVIFSAVIVGVFIATRAGRR